MVNKYNAKETIIDGMKFPSKAEGDFYLYLKDLKDKGKILFFDMQPKFELIPKFINCNKNFRNMTYTPDFKITYNNMVEEYVDVKGMLTDRTAIKIKLLRHMYPNLKLTLLVQRGKKGAKWWLDIETKKEWEFWEEKN